MVAKRQTSGLTHKPFYIKYLKTTITKKTKQIMSTEVKTCTSKCKSEAQDKYHGEGRRAMNKNSKSEYTCTVCGTKRK